MPNPATPPPYAYGPLARVLARRLGKTGVAGAFVPEQTKRDLLAEIKRLAKPGRHSGGEFIVDLGAEVAHEAGHPFVRALRSQPSAARMLEVWRRLEVLAHSHNRVQVLALDERRLHLLRYRVAGSDARPMIEEDLLILGILQGLLACLGMGDFRLEGPHPQAQGNEWIMHFVMDTSARIPLAPASLWYGPGELEQVVFALLGERILAQAPLDLASVALKLGMSRRSLQRHLRMAGSSYSTLLRTAMVAAAGEALVSAQDVTITDTALRLGFADGAHLCRAFRELVGCSPRDLVRAVQPPIGA